MFFALRITLEILSGLGNPSWTVPSTTAEECVRRVSTLHVANTREAPPSGLGYRGLRVSGKEVQQTLGADEVFVGQKRVLLLRGDKVFSAREDAGRALEELLLASGAGEVDPALLFEARQSLSSP